MIHRPPTLRTLLPGLILALPGVLGPAAAAAGEIAGSVAQEPGEPAPASAPAPEPAAPTEPQSKPCPTREEELDAWIDRFRAGVYKTVCVSAFRFDSLFGGSRADFERNETFGRVGAIALWDEIDHYDYDLRLKVKYRLPRMRRRIDAILGRGTDEEFVRGRENQLDFLPGAFAEADAEWLAGLGYSPIRNPRNRVDFNVGVNIDTPVEPYGNIQYRRHYFLGDRALARFREILWWRSERGYGFTSRLDLDRVLTRKTLARLAASATLSERSEGVEWAGWLTLFQNLGTARAIALQAEYKGATDSAIPVRGYGGRAILRHQVLREWLVLEARAGVVWRRATPTSPREATPELGFGFELQFGERTLEPPAEPVGQPPPAPVSY